MSDVARLPLPARALGLALLGGTVGTLFDWVHCATGAIRYADPAFMGLAWWVPLVYVGAALGIGLSHPPLDRLHRRKARWPHSPARLAGGVVALVALWVASGLFVMAGLGPLAITALLAPASLATWWVFDRTGAGLSLAVGTALVGMGVECVLITQGLFSHTQTDLGLIPSWLGFIYVGASVGLGNLGRWLAEPTATA